MKLTQQNLLLLEQREIDDFALRFETKNQEENTFTLSEKTKAKVIFVDGSIEVSF